MSRPARETIMNALFAALTSSVNVPFTANTANGSAILSNPSTLVGLYLGLPVFGVGIPRGATIDSLAPLTLSQPATADGTAVPMTTGFLTYSRRFQFWNTVTAQPAMFLRDGNEEVMYAPSATSFANSTSMQMLVLNAELWVYSQAGANPDIPPAMVLNNLLDAVQRSFAPDSPSNQFTLGGIVSWCRINGVIHKTPGDIDQQSIATADVQILVP